MVTKLVINKCPWTLALGNACIKPMNCGALNILLLLSYIYIHVESFKYCKTGPYSLIEIKVYVKYFPDILLNNDT